MLGTVLPANAAPFRIALFDAELSGRGPGLMLRDLRRATPRSVSAASLIAKAAPDIVILLGIDYDYDLHGIRALRDLVAEQGHPMVTLFSLPTNRGLQSGIDLNGDRKTRGPEDAQGFGRFYGEGGMAILSRWPIERQNVQDFTTLLWKDLPAAQMPFVLGAPFPSTQAHANQRLSSNGHWIVPILTPNGPLEILTFDATPPVFDGPEDRNGLRNADEIRLWQKVLDGQLGNRPLGPFAIVGNANLDLDKGAGSKGALRALLSHPQLQDPHPVDKNGIPDTADWPEPTPGNMRVDYVLPSIDLTISGSGLIWPEGQDTSRHALIWVDFEMYPADD